MIRRKWNKSRGSQWQATISSATSVNRETKRREKKLRDRYAGVLLNSGIVFVRLVASPLVRFSRASMSSAGHERRHCNPHSFYDSQSVCIWRANVTRRLLHSCRAPTVTNVKWDKVSGNLWVLAVSLGSTASSNFVQASPPHRRRIHSTPDSGAGIIQ